MKELGSLLVPLAVPTSPLQGEIYFNTGTNQLMEYTGSAWIAVGSNVSAAAPSISTLEKFGVE